MDFSFPFFSFMVRKPKVIHFHGIDVEFLKRYHLSRMIMKHLLNYYISISRKMTDQLLDLGINRHEIAYLPNGVDVNLFRPNGEKTDNLLLFVGRVTLHKGLNVLVKSLHYLKKPVHLVLIGPVENTEKTTIFKLIEDETQRGQHKITYLGVMNNVDIIKWYQKATLFVLPSFYEGFPITIIEALSCETPVVATPVGGIPEVVEDHKTGTLIPLNNPIALAEAIEYLLDNKGIRDKYGQEGRKKVIQTYSLEKSVEKLTQIYRQIVS
jgi:glycosyltransferase involved in cell wall biosynthesis